MRKSTKTRGRPPATEATRYRRITITLPPDIADKLRGHPEGSSALIARLLREEM